MKEIILDLEDVLYRQGIEPFSNMEEVFTPANQKAIKVVQTSNLDEDKKIQARVKKGYMWDESKLRSEQVIVYKFTKTAKPNIDE